MYKSCVNCSTPALMKCRSTLIQCLAKLINWADTMLLVTDAATQNSRIKSVPDLVGEFLLFSGVVPIPNYFFCLKMSFVLRC